jgi:isopentenyl diphosphate isomerase/L-lactate dehydrogenase-like FMN-dependent dehydrogenase
MKMPDDETPDDRTIVAEMSSAPAEGASRRQAIGVMGTTAAAGVVGVAMPALGAPAESAGTTPLRMPVPPPALVPRADLVNVLEYEAQARLVLGPAKVAPILGSDRTVTDRITLRPRMNIPTRDLDLTSTLFGDEHFTPDVLAGANAAKAKAVIVTVNAGTSAGAPAKTAAIDWAAVDTVVKGTSLPVIVKGITSPQDAKEAVAHGAKGVVVSNYRGGNAAALTGTLLLVAPVVQAVGDQVPVLVDGSFRRGTDILKALGFGAKGVLIGRPVMWGLAAYGAEGVQGVVEMLQTELARYMCMCGRPSLAAVNPSLVRVHAPLTMVKKKHA